MMTKETTERLLRAMSRASEKQERNGNGPMTRAQSKAFIQGWMEGRHALRNEDHRKQLERELREVGA